MAKIIDYPRASLRSALQLAEAIDGFAGSCSQDLAAEKLGKKVSGAFAAQIGAAVKYGLIDSKNGKLSVCPLYRDYKLSYTAEDAMKCLQKALLSPPLFNAIYERFRGQKLPIEHFEKMLIKEFNVPDVIASRVSRYFLEGGKQSGLLNEENILGSESSGSSYEEVIEEEENFPVTISNPIVGRQEKVETSDTQKNNNSNDSDNVEDFWLNIRGPGVNFSIEIKDSDDLDIVHIMLKKIDKALKLKNA